MIATVQGWSQPQEWYKMPAQESKPLWLNAGQPYHLFAQVQEEGGADHLEIAVQVPANASCSLPICACTARPRYVNVETR